MRPIGDIPEQMQLKLKNKEHNFQVFPDKSCKERTLHLSGIWCEILQDTNTLVNVDFLGAWTRNKWGWCGICAQILPGFLQNYLRCSPVLVETKPFS